MISHELSFVVFNWL